MKNWSEYLIEAYDQMVKTIETREIGKILAQPNEYMQKDWINANTTLKVHKDEGGNDSDKNGSGYDLISKNGLRIQSKFRSSTFHLETTRRNSKKNQGAASTSGHVAYSVGEADVYCFTKPNGDYRDPGKAEIIAIPEQALIDPKNPGFLRKSISKTIQKQWEGKSVETLEMLDAAIATR